VREKEKERDKREVKHRMGVGEGITRDEER